MRERGQRFLDERPCWAAPGPLQSLGSRAKSALQVLAGVGLIQGLEVEPGGARERTRHRWKEAEKTKEKYRESGGQVGPQVHDEGRRKRISLEEDPKREVPRGDRMTGGAST